MSQLVTSAAHFAVCVCRRHGQIISASGERGPHSITKRQARAALFAFVEQEKIAPDEIAEAARQLELSPLFSASDELERFTVDIVNGIHGFYDPDEGTQLFPKG